MMSIIIHDDKDNDDDNILFIYLFIYEIRSEGGNLQ